MSLFDLKPNNTNELILPCHYSGRNVDERGDESARNASFSLFNTAPFALSSSRSLEPSRVTDVGTWFLVPIYAATLLSRVAMRVISQAVINLF